MLEYKSKLDKIGLIIKKQIINHDNKVIGIYVTYKDEDLFVPLEPSSIQRFYDYELVHDGLWTSYDSTKHHLKEIHEHINTLNCKPVFKVIDKEHIVGIITNANQFVKFEIITDVEDELEVIKGINELQIDKEILSKVRYIIEECKPIFNTET